MFQSFISAIVAGFVAIGSFFSGGTPAPTMLSQQILYGSATQSDYTLVAPANTGAVVIKAWGGGGFGACNYGGGIGGYAAAAYSLSAGQSVVVHVASGVGRKGGSYGPGGDGGEASHVVTPGGEVWAGGGGGAGGDVDDSDGPCGSGLGGNAGSALAPQNGISAYKRVVGVGGGITTPAIKGGARVEGNGGSGGGGGGYNPGSAGAKLAGGGGGSSFAAGSPLASKLKVATIPSYSTKEFLGYDPLVAKYYKINSLPIAKKSYDAAAHGAVTSPIPTSALKQAATIVVGYTTKTCTRTGCSGGDAIKVSGYTISDPSSGSVWSFDTSSQSFQAMQKVTEPGYLEDSDYVGNNFASKRVALAGAPRGGADGGPGAVIVQFWSGVATVDPGTCANGAADYPICATIVSGCPNGAPDYPICTATGSCENGALDYPTCTATGAGDSGTSAGDSTSGSGDSATAPLSPDFSIDSSSSLKVKTFAGGGATSDPKDVVITRTGGFSGPVLISVSSNIPESSTPSLILDSRSVLGGAMLPVLGGSIPLSVKLSSKIPGACISTMATECDHYFVTVTGSALIDGVTVTHTKQIELVQEALTPGYSEI
ncbi:MAG: hypothetical protein WC763_03755 [Candidatus Paceibacterota bacterium]|jgi:hypothetical protein